VGLRTLTVETWREDLRGWVRVEVAPSVRVRPTGAYFGVNAHFQLSTEAGRGTGHEAARTIEEEWDTTRELEVELLGSSSKPHA
jgi:hypothetical protein